MLAPTRIDGVWTGDIGPETNDKERRASMLNSEQIETLRRNADETPNHGYPTFPESGPNETLGTIGHAFADIDQRIDGISGEMGELGVADIHDATDTGRALMTATDAEAAREAIGAGTSSFDGAYTSLTAIPSEFTPAAHTHVMADITDLQPAMDLKADRTDIPTVTTIEGAGEAGRAVIAANTVQDAVNALGLTSVYKYKGSVADNEALPEDAEPGDVYNVESDGMNYAWNGTSWDALGMDVTLAGLGVTATANDLNMTAGATSNIQTQLDAKADASAIADMLTKTEAADTYQPKGEYQPAGDYPTTTAMNEALALKQDAATAFDGKYTSLTEVPSEFTPKAHTHVKADITDLDLSQFADYEIDTDHVIQIDSTFGTTAVGMKAGVYLVTEGDDTPAEIQEWKGSVGFEGTLTGYLHLFDYMPDGQNHDHLALLMAAIRSADGSKYASGVFVYDGPQHKWMIQTSGMGQVRGLDAALALKADKTEIGDMLTKTEAASTYQAAGDYATKGELAAKADATAIADMLTKTEAADAYQPKGEYATADAIADMETKTEASATYQPKGDYATKTEVTDGLAAKQDAATAFDGKYTSLTEVPSQFTPAAHTHVMADITDTDLSQHADYAIDMAHVITLKPTFASDAVSMKAGVYLVTDDGSELTPGLQEWKESVGFEGSLTGYLNLYDYMPDGERHDHLALLLCAVRATDGTKYAGNLFVFDGPSNRFVGMGTIDVDSIPGLTEAIEAAAQPKDGAITTTKIAPMAVTTDKLADDAVTADKIADGVIPTIPGNATTDDAGLMSAEDKTKLDGLNNYVLPEATADVLGGVKVGAGLTVQDGKLTTSTESRTFANPEVIGSDETLDLATATNGVYSISGGSITGLTGSNDSAAALVINAGATHPSAIAFDGAFAADKVLPVCQDGTTWFKLTAMDRAEFVPDPAGDTVTKEEFIALRDALVTAGIMKPQA